MLLSDAIARVRILVDDVEEKRWSPEAVNAALLAGQSEAMIAGMAAGASFLGGTTQVVTDATGLADLSAIRPLSIAAVHLQTSAGYLEKLEGVSPAAPWMLFGSVVTLRLTYVPRPAFPALDSDAFAWSTGAIVQPTLEEMMCLSAAMALKPTEGEVLVGGEERRKSLAETIRNLVHIPRWRAMATPCRYVRPRGYELGWLMTGDDQLQLVRYG